jgi:hypothetical protein
MHSWSTFGAKMSHEQTKIYRTYHGPNLGKSPPSPLQYTLCLFTRPTSKWHFVLGLLNGSLEIPKVGTLATLGPYNFVCRPPIEMRSKTKFYPLPRAFQRYVAHHQHARKSGRFLTFSGRESNYQFDSWPFFWP